MSAFRARAFVVAAALLMAASTGYALLITPDYDDFTGTELDVLKDAVQEWADLLPCKDGLSISIRLRCNNSMPEGTLGETDNWTYDAGGHVTAVDITFHNDRLYWTLDDPALWDNAHANSYDALGVAKHEVAHALGWTVNAALFNAHVRTVAGNRFYDMNDDNIFNDNDFDLIDNASYGTHAADNTDLMYPWVPPATRRHPTLHQAQVLGDAFGYCTIPEPATLTLLGLGASGLAWLRRRRCAR